MSSSARAANEFSVQELKDKLRLLGLSTSGVKSELIARLMNADPSGDWMQGSEGVREGLPANEAAGASQETAASSLAEKEIAVYRMQAELLRKENELAMRELALARQEIEMLKRLQEVNVSTERASSASQQVSTEQSTATIPSPIPRQGLSIHLVADLLKTYGGEIGEYENWETQLKLLKNAYCLDNEQTKILIGMKLKGKALEWLQSKPSHIVMPTEELLEQLRGMFHHHHNVLHLRRQFEERIWKAGETFHEYVHQKVILANRVPIDNREIVLHLIQGIPDPLLQDQARLLQFKTKEALLGAFEQVMLRPAISRGHNDGHQRDKTHDERNQHRNIGNHHRQEDARIKRCYNCGLQDHYGANCPVKHRGAKCFECREFGHIAARCPKKNNSMQAPGKERERDESPQRINIGGSYESVVHQR